MKNKIWHRPYSALSEKDKADIRKFYLTGIPSHLDLAIIYKVSCHTIEKVCKGLAPTAMKNRNERFNWLGDDAIIYANRKELYFHMTKKYKYGYGEHPFENTIYWRAEEKYAYLDNH